MRFAAPELEEAYRFSALAGDLRRTRLLCWLTAIGAVLFVSQDYVTFGMKTGFFVGLAIRLTVVLSAGAYLLRLRRPITPDGLDRAMLVFSLLLAVLVLFGYATRPIPRMGHGLIALTVLALSMAVPMSFRRQVVISIGFFLAAMAALALKRPDPFLMYGTFFVTALSAALGIITAASIHRAQRESFAAHGNESRLRQEVEAALAEIKTLRGLLPICAACKNIRRDDGAWSRIEAYISEHTHAQFTHGICPDCQERLYPETLPAKTAD